MLVPWYLILSYAYYFLNVSLVSDGLYDRICKELLAAMDAFDVDHRHMSLCNMDALEAGTAFHLKKEDYPGITVSCAEQFAVGGYV
jgi:NAD-dependent DNA ligase